MKRLIFSILAAVVMCAGLYAAQTTIDNVGSLTTPQAMIQAIDNNFTELYGKWTSLGTTHDTSAELDALYEGELDNEAGLYAALSDVTDFVQPSELVFSNFTEQTAWRVFYSNGDGDVTELALGADGTYLKSNGATSAPTFATPSGSGDVSKVGTPADDEVGIWTGDGTIEGSTWAELSRAIGTDIQAYDATLDAISSNGYIDSFLATANNSADENVYPVFVDGATGGQGAETDTGFYYNPSTGILTAGGFNTTPGSNPAVELQDSDAPGTDKESAKIYSNYVDGADGSENHDLFFQVKQGGSYTTLLQFDESDDQWEFQKNTTLQSNDIIAGEIADFYAYDVIPVAWMKDGTSAPAALDDASTRSPYAYRDFDSTADEDLNFIWFVPSDLSGTTIQYRVKYLITNATGPSATEGVAFGLSGVSAGDNDASNGTKGTVVVVQDDTLNAAQHDVMITGWSGDVTVTALAAGEVAEMALIRDVSDTVDDYGQDVGVFALEIRYVKNPAR